MIPKVIILIGVPGSGKGTQAKKIAARYQAVHISTGDLLRTLAKSSDISPADQKELEQMKHGKLVSDQLIFRVAFAAIIDALREHHGVVLDGAIRTVNQAKEFSKFFVEHGLSDSVIAIEMALSDETIMKRLTGRRVCAVCGHIVAYSKENQQLSACPVCGGALVTRHDDTPEVIAERIREQGNTAIVPIVSYYREQGLLHRIDAEKSVEEVDAAVRQLLEK